MDTGILILNSKDRPPSDNPVDVNFDTDFLNFIDVNKIAVSSYFFNYTVPNVNPRNNKGAVSDGATSYPFQMPEGFYDMASFLIAFETALNTTPLIFTVLESAPNTIEVTCTVPFTFVNNGEVKRDLADLAGMSYDTPLSLAQTGCFTNLIYTPYIDIVSPTLHQFHSLLDFATNRRSNNFLTRVYLDKYTEGTAVFREVTNYKWINVVNASATNQLRIQLLDADGEPLYNPCPDGDSLSWNIEMVTI